MANSTIAVYSKTGTQLLAPTNINTIWSGFGGSCETENAGDPDSVYRQICEYRERVGPFEHLVLASRSGFMTHGEATKGLRLFAKEVLPRLREL